MARTAQVSPTMATRPGAAAVGALLPPAAVKTAKWWAIGQTAQAGLRIDDIFVTGRAQTTRDDLLAALRLTRGAPMFGFDPEAKFVVSDDVYAYYREAAQRGAKAHAAWDAMMARCVLRAWVESVCSSSSAPHELLAVPPAATPRPSPTRPLPSRAASVRVA